MIDFGAAMTGAKIHYKGSRWWKAAALFRTAVSQKPANAEAHFWLGLSLAQIGKESLITAAEEFDTCFTLDGTYPAKVTAEEENTYLVTRALSASAEAEMVRTAALDPEAAKAGFRTAIRFIRWALAINPSNPNYYMTLGNAYVGLDMPDSIRIVSEDLDKKDKESAQAAFFMGIYYAKKEQSDSALTSFALAGTRYEAAVARQQEKLDTLLKLKSPEKTRQIADRLAALRNNQLGLKTYIEDTLKAQRLLQQIAEIANNLFVDRFQIGLAFYRSGMACVQLGHLSSDTLAQRRYFSKAETLFTHAAAADPENYDALWYIGYADYRLTRDTATIAAFRRAVTVSDSRKDMIAAKDAEVWMYMGTAEARLKQYDSAIVHLRRALRADPTRGEAYTNLAFTFKEMGKGDMNSPWTDSAVQALEDKDKTGWRIAAWSADDAEALGSLKAGGGKRFVVVEFTIFNKTDKADTANPAKLYLTGNDKNNYYLDAAATAAEALEGRGFTTAKPVEGNAKLECVGVFVVPTGVAPLFLVYQPKPNVEAKAIMPENGNDK